MAKETEKKVAEKKPSQKSKKPNKIARWFKDLKGEIKKIFWPDAKTVFRNTLIVIVVVAIAAAIIYLFDQGMTLINSSAKKFSEERKAATSAADTTDAETSQEALSEVADTTTEAAE